MKTHSIIAMVAIAALIVVSLTAILVVPAKKNSAVTINNGSGIRVGAIAVPGTYANSTLWVNGTLLITVNDGNPIDIGTYKILPSGNIYYSGSGLMALSHKWQFAFVMSEESKYPPCFSLCSFTPRDVKVIQTTFCSINYYRDDVCQTFWHWTDETSWHIAPSAPLSGQPIPTYG